MTTHDEFATWDAAYVLGALSPAERRAFEAHLRDCDRCSEAVSELAGMPGILSRVPREQAFALLDEVAPDAAPSDEPGPTPELLPSLLHRVQRRRVRARWLVASLSTVAAALLIGLAAVVLPSVLNPPAAPQAGVAMQQVEPSPLTAEVRLTAEPWGTRIDSTCRYAHVSGAQASQTWTYAMVVTDRAGHQHTISTWTADEGSTVRPVATTSIAVADIAAVDIRSATDSTVLLRTTFD